jgi:DNA-binding XRE family transcriptional regulator
MTGRTMMRIRKSMHISRKALAKAVGLSEREIAYLETDKRKPSIITALRIEHFFGKPFKILFEISETELIVLNSNIVEQK